MGQSVQNDNRACWVKANCLPLAMSAEIRSIYGRMRNSSKDDEVRNVTFIASTLNVEAMFELGKVLAEGSDGIEKDVARAAELYS